MTAVLSAAAAYLIGAVPIGFLVARVLGITDIRQRGSGNIGATNVLRVLGRLPAVITLIGDVAKGYVGVMVGRTLVGGDPAPTVACAVAAVMGHCWPVFLRFRGGKGVATGLGAALALVPLATLPAAAVWVAVAGTFRYISLASLLASLSMPLSVFLLHVLLHRYSLAAVVAYVAIAGIVALRHRDNIARLISGSERRLGERAT